MDVVERRARDPGGVDILCMNNNDHLRKINATHWQIPLKFKGFSEQYIDISLKKLWLVHKLQENTL